MSSVDLYSQNITDVHREKLKGQVKSIKTREYYTNYNTATQKIDTILLPNELLNSDKSFDSNGNLIEDIDYYYKKRTLNVYNTKNQLVEKTVFKTKDKDLIEEKSSYKYDIDGKMTEETVNDINGNLLRRYQNKYDKTGYLIENIQFEKDYKPKRRNTYKYNNQGKLLLKIEQYNYWQSKTDYNHKYQADYYKNNNLRKETHFGTSSYGGYKEYERYYYRTGLDSIYIKYYKNGLIEEIENHDDKGNLIKNISYTENRKIEQETNYKNTYNSNGKLVKVVITGTDDGKNGESIYRYDTKNRLIYSDEKTSFYGANVISEIKYDKLGNVIYSSNSDYAERRSFTKTKYDNHNNRVSFYEDNGGADGESGHDNYSLYLYEIDYYPYRETDIVNVGKAKIYNSNIEDTTMYVMKGDKLFTYYRGEEYTSFDYKTKQGIYISGFIKNIDIMKLNNH